MWKQALFVTFKKAFDKKTLHNPQNQGNKQRETHCIGLFTVINLEVYYDVLYPII